MTLRYATLLLVFLLASLTVLTAQEARIHGRVTDNAGEPLIGATVRVVNSVIGSATDAEGDYEFEVPVGRIRISYNYLGYQDLDTFIRVVDAVKDIRIDVALDDATIDIEGEVIVFGRRSVGQTGALRLQQAAPNLQNIVHSELFNRYPDVTLAETVQRLPGVTITRNEGQGEFVQIRGAPEQFTVISLNGQRLPSVRPESDRAASLDFIQSNLIEDVRVIKSLTADMDADAIGGTVDFRLRQPEEKLELLAQVGYGTNLQESVVEDLPQNVRQAALSINSELADESVYGLLSGSFFQNGLGSLRNRYEYGENATTGTTINRVRSADIDRRLTERGFLGAVELRPSIYNRLRLSYNYNKSIDEVVQREATYDAARRREDRETTNWREESTLNLVTLEVENNFKRSRLDYSISYAATSQELPGRYRFRSTRQADLDGIEDPFGLTPTSIPPQAADDQLVLTRVGREEISLEEDIAIGSVNYTYFLSERQNSYLKTGFRYRVRDRRYGTLNRVLIPDFDRTLAPGTFDFAELRNADGISGINDAQLQGEPRADSSAYDSQEEIFAAYLMNTTNWSGRFSTTIGLRAEATQNSYNQLITEASDDISYRNLFPSVNLTYRLKPDRQLRLAYYEALARPPFAVLLPFDQAQVGNREIIRGNAEGEPTIGRNIDLAYERYGRRDGLFTVGLYAKSFDRPFVENAEFLLRDDEPLLFTTITNANSALLYGIEFAFYQNLGFISPGLRFVNVNATYSLNESDVRSDDPTQDGLPLINSPRQAANLSVVYNDDKRGISLVVAGVYKGYVLDRVQDGTPLYRAPTFNLDVAVDLRLVSALSLYLRLNNLTNLTYEQYLGEPREDDSRLYQSEKFDRWGVVGLRWRM
ncbi:MAG: TonB-dependent receptor [Saprospiraceae bacterium]